VIGSGIPLDYTVGDRVVLKDYPEFEYSVDAILDGGELVLATDGDVSGFALPGPALRKADDND